MVEYQVQTFPPEKQKILVEIGTSKLPFLAGWGCANKVVSSYLVWRVHYDVSGKVGKSFLNYVIGDEILTIR